MKGMLWKGGSREHCKHKDQPVKRSVAGRRVSLTGDEDAPRYEGKEAVRYHPRKGGVWLIGVSQAKSGSVPFPKRRGAMEQGREGQRKERK